MLTTFFVDGVAAAGGDGSAALPFNSIQDAVDAASAAPGADTIDLATGEYVENVDIDDGGDVRILGNGSTLTAANNGSRAMDVDNSGVIAIYDLTITGASGDGLRVRDSDSLTLDRVTLIGNGDEGLQTDGVDEVTLSHLKANFNGDHGIQIEAADVVDVSHTMTMKNGGDGLKIEDTGSVVIADSNFLSNGLGEDANDGIDLEIIGTVVIYGINASNNTDEGLEVDDVESISVSNSVFKNNGEAGIDIDDAISILIDQVSATHNSEHGLQIESQDDDDPYTSILNVRVLDSVFSNNVGDGIQITEEGIATVDNVLVSRVKANANREIDEDDGGHGLFIEISGAILLDKIVAKNNPRGNVPTV